MIKNNYPFGAQIVNNFTQGDLVYWNEWKIVNKKLHKKKKFGVFVEKCSKFLGNREVLYAVVVSAETGNTIDVLAVRLKKEETN